MGIKDYSQEEVVTVATGAVGDEACLINIIECGKIERRRQLEIFSRLARHVTAIIYLVAELHLGYKPEKL